MKSDRQQNQGFILHNHSLFYPVKSFFYHYKFQAIHA